MTKGGLSFGNFAFSTKGMITLKVHLLIIV
jgi:hypothetical protein